MLVLRSICRLNRFENYYNYNMLRDRIHYFFYFFIRNQLKYVSTKNKSIKDIDSSFLIVQLIQKGHYSCNICIYLKQEKQIQ